MCAASASVCGKYEGDFIGKTQDVVKEGAILGNMPSDTREFPGNG